MADYFIQVSAPGDEQTVRRKLQALLEHGTICEALGDAGVEVTSASVVPASTDADAELDRLWTCAHIHGEESEPEHEVGDLQALTRLCWQLLSDGQREIVSATFRDQVFGAW